MSAYWLIIFAAMLWGTTGTSQALAPEGATGLTIGTMRLVVGGLALLAIALSQGKLQWSRAWLRWETLVAGLMMALYQVVFFIGVGLTGVAVGTIVGIGSAPIFAGIFGYFFQSEKLSKRWLIATALAILGCLILVFSGNEEMKVDPLGMLLALGAGLSYAIFTLVNKRLIEDFPSDAAMAVSFSLAALLLLPSLFFVSSDGELLLQPSLFFVNTAWIASTSGLLVILHLGLLATGLSYFLFGRGLMTVPVSTTGTLTLFEPLTAALLGIFLLGESLSVMAFVGIAVLFAGLAVLVFPKHKNKAVLV
jgi:DME family drug/metabolite transporter